MKEFKFDSKTDNLFKAVLSLKSVKEAEAFFRDLCTIQEIGEMSERWEVVRLLGRRLPYREIADKLKVSTTTVGRVANWLYNGMGGYRLALNRLGAHHHSFSFGKGLR